MAIDVTIIGGSFAGQAAALHLARARRNIVLADTKSPRNRFAHASYGFLGQDGAAPAAIIGKAEEQLKTYATVGLVNSAAISARQVDDGFCIGFADGSEVLSRVVILAVGARDVLPNLAGLTERWGVTVLHCPYCHGYELDQRPLGILATGPNAFHQAMLGPDWGPTTLFAQGVFEPTPEQRVALVGRGVTIETSPIIELLGEAPALDAVRLADGRVVEIAGLFVAPRVEVLPDLAVQLGCALSESSFGVSITVDERQQTSIPGIFAAGNAANLMANATISAASGVTAASNAHQTLVFGVS